VAERLVCPGCAAEFPFMHQPGCASLVYEPDHSDRPVVLPAGAEYRPLYRSPGELIREWHEKFGQQVRDTPDASATLEEIAYRKRLVDEEAKELLLAMYDRDVVAVADALADLIYVVWGIAVSYGIDLDAVLAEVHRSNMTKTYDPSRAEHAGKVVVKGEGFEEPRIADVLGVASGQRGAE
jgi:predicted HAD superfamily Cof-like phosphohydrolase